MAIDKHFSNFKKVHSRGTVVEHNLRFCVVDMARTDIPNSAFCYINDFVLADSNSDKKINRIIDSVNHFNEENYVDVHSWIVTPKSFETMIYELNMIGLLDIYVDKIVSEKNSVEFYVELKKGKVNEKDTSKRLQLYIDRKKEDFEEFEDFMEIEKFKLFLIDNPNEKLYIFGTGKGSLRIKRILNYMRRDFDGYIVSDGKRIDKNINGKPVFELSEMRNIEGCAVLIGTTLYRADILPNLKQKGLKYFF